MHNPFKSLEKDPIIRDRLAKKKKKHTYVAPGKKADTPQKPHSETDEFLQAVSDVAPLSGTGRQVAGSMPRRRARTSPEPTFARLLEENIEFDMEHTHEFMSGQIVGLDAKIFRKLKNGEFSIEGHLDLHGQNSDQAKIAVMAFVRRHYMEGRRCLLIIPGRGLNSPLGQGVLRQELSTWLTRAPLKRIVLAFSTALPKHGGSGAVYVLLRQVRKDQGKIAWEDIFTDLDG